MPLRDLISGRKELSGQAISNQVEAVAMEKRGAIMAQVALAWSLSKPLVTAPIGESKMSMSCISRVLLGRRTIGVQSRFKQERIAQEHRLLAWL